MFDKAFWEAFMKTHGSRFDGEDKLFYLYSEHYDLEEENCQIAIISPSILQIWMVDEDKSGRHYQYVNMETIKDVNIWEASTE